MPGASCEVSRLMSGARCIGLVGALSLVFAGLVALTSEPARAGISTGDGGWVWQNPTPTGQDYHDLAFVDARSGWIVGEFGTILHTVDGGRHWYRQRSDANVALRAVTFIDGATGWAVGDAGTVLHTTDGGDGWTRQGPGTAAALHGVAFADARHGWAVGEDGLILHTSDGGQTWARQPSGTEMGLSDIACVSADLAYAVGASGTLLQTTSAGDRWAPANAPNLSSYADLTDVVAFGAGRACATLGGSSVVGTTTGDYWSKWIVARSEYVPLVGVDFCDVEHGWTVGGEGVCYSTTDGGRSWQKQSTATNRRLRAVDFADELHGWAVGTWGTIIATADGGRTWAEQSLGTQPNASAGVEFYAVSFLDSANGVASGWGRTTARTTDGGEAWSIDSPGVSAGRLFGIDFVDSGHAWAAGEGDAPWDGIDPEGHGQVLFSGDGGANWAMHDASAEDDLLCVDFADPLHGMVGSYDRRIRWTADGGGTWSERSLLFRVYGISYPDPEHCWAVGENGYVGAWQGGYAWDRQRVVAATLRDVDFADALHGWAVGEQGTVIATSDGGLTWLRQQSGTDVTLCDVTMVDARGGWIVGEQGTILATTDGGATWSGQASGTDYDLYGVAAVDNMTAWAVGQFNTILATTNGGVPAADEKPPVTAISAPPTGWQDEPVELTLSAADPGGVQVTTWAVQPTTATPAVFSWSVGERLTVTRQGVSVVLYRSIDDAGNAETPKRAVVRLDTRHPKPQARWRARCRRGRTATLKCRILDARPGGPTAQVTIRIRNRKGRLVKTLRVGRCAVNKVLKVRFRCRLRRGTYRFYVLATDAAGNKQTRIASNRLIVR